MRGKLCGHVSCARSCGSRRCHLVSTPRAGSTYTRLVHHEGGLIHLQAGPAAVLEGEARDALAALDDEEGAGAVELDAARLQEAVGHELGGPPGRYGRWG